VNFFQARFGKGRYMFEKAMFQGHVNFSSITDIYQVENLSFKGAGFDKTLDLSGNSLTSIIDLTATKTTNHVSLADLHCMLPFECIKKGHLNFNKAKDPADIARLRRLKEITENNKDHERALAFHADEMRAKRWHENTTIRGMLFDYVYDRLSNYGRSESRPLFCLSIIWLWFGGIYFIYAKCSELSPNILLSEALAFSGSQLLPFVSGSRLAQKEGVDTLFDGDLSPLIHGITFVQSILSLILLFLVGLALRNRFRI
jgi:hypothetical protein